MKTIIAGSRAITNFDLLEQVIEQSDFQITTVITGCAKGIDTLGIKWGEIHGVPILRFPAQWSRYGRGAGPIRNKEMSENADACIVIWDGHSQGAKNMIELAHKYDLRLYVHRKM